MRSRTAEAEACIHEVTFRRVVLFPFSPDALCFVAATR
jgi:hypothetical protein